MSLSKPEVMPLDLAAVGSWLLVLKGSGGWRRTEGGSPSASTIASDIRVPDAFHVGLASTAHRALGVCSRGEFGVQKGRASNNRLQQLRQRFEKQKLSRRKHAAPMTGIRQRELRDLRSGINRRR